MIKIHEHFMQRCLQLAQLGLGNVAPNPMVGCVIVYENKIIGEGYHHHYGEAHAEVNAINSVHNKSLLPESTLYVNLEPCAHFGKTPPCADLIIKYKIKTVVIGCGDPFESVNGKGIEKLKAAGIEVITDVLQTESLELNKRFFTFHLKKRPYIILKWAQSADGFIGAATPNNHAETTTTTTTTTQWISNALSRKLVHKWRSEEQAILIGTNTALIDNPTLNTRDWQGKSPLRIILDKSLRLPTTLAVFKQDYPTLIFNAIKNEEQANLHYLKINFDNVMTAMLHYLYEKQIQSVIVEGGSVLLDSFIEAGLWDEARIFKSTMQLNDGVKAPIIKATIENKFQIENDILEVLKNENNGNYFQPSIIK